jgi:hypothetical protein
MPLRDAAPLSASLNRESAERLSEVFVKLADTLSRAESPLNPTITPERLRRIAAYCIAYGAGAEPHPAIAATLDWHDAVTSLANLPEWLTEDAAELEQYREELSDEERAAHPRPDATPLLQAFVSVEPDAIAAEWRRYAAARLALMEVWRAPELARIAAVEETTSRFEELRASLDPATSAQLDASFASMMAAHNSYKETLLRGKEEDEALLDNPRGTPEHWLRLFGSLDLDLAALLPDERAS